MRRRSRRRPIWKRNILRMMPYRRVGTLALFIACCGGPPFLAIVPLLSLLLVVVALSLAIPLPISCGGGLLPNTYGYYRWYKGRMRRRAIKLRKVIWMVQGCRGGHTSRVLLLVAAAHALVDCFFLLVPISFVSFLSLYTMYYIYYKYYRCYSPPYSSSPSIVCTTYDIVIIYDI